MIRRPNPYANISLEPPPTVAANFDVPQMEFAPPPQIEAPDTAGQSMSLGQSIMGLKRKFGSKQKDQLLSGLVNPAGGDMA